MRAAHKLNRFPSLAAGRTVFDKVLVHADALRAADAIDAARAGGFSQESLTLA